MKATALPGSAVPATFIISRRIGLCARAVRVQSAESQVRVVCKLFCKVFLVRCYTVLLLMLGQPFRALLNQKLLLLAEFRFGINSGYKESIFLHDGCRNRPELDIGLQALKDGVVRQVQIADDLAVVRRVLGHPPLQLDHQSDFREKNRLQLRR